MKQRSSVKEAGRKIKDEQLAKGKADRQQEGENTEKQNYPREGNVGGMTAGNYIKRVKGEKDGRKEKN